MAARIPTVLKLSEGLLSLLFHVAFGRGLLTRTMTTQNQSLSQKCSIQLSTIDKTSSAKTYDRLGEEDENDLESTHSDNSRANIISRNSGPNRIKVETSFVVGETQGERTDTRLGLRPHTTKALIQATSDERVT